MDDLGGSARGFSVFPSRVQPGGCADLAERDAMLKFPARRATGMSDQAEATAKRAYELYLERGSAPGYELEDWLQAEAEMAAAATDEAREGARDGKPAGSAERGRPEAATSRRSGRRENAPAAREGTPNSSTGRRALRP